MASRPKVALGVTRRPEHGLNLGIVDWAALGLSLFWIIVCALIFLVSPSDPDAPRPRNGFGFITTLLAVVMPVALIWVATFASRANRIMREESERLQAAIDAMRQAYIAANQDKAAPPRSELDKKVDDLLKAQKRTETLLGQLTTAPGATPATVPMPAPKPIVAAAPPPDDTQPTLGLEAPAEALKDQISTDDFLRALNFPEDETDREGFRALRIALKDRTSAGLVRSAQDVLTLLAEDGIYMDDLTPEIAKPLIWRNFAKGARGRAIASLGGVRDRASLALAAGRMRQDPIFRDVTHHFLRKFDHTLVEFEKTASDADIVSLADTRTARAFMLLGRVSGTFD